MLTTLRGIQNSIGSLSWRGPILLPNYIVTSFSSTNICHAATQTTWWVFDVLIFVRKTNLIKIKIRKEEIWWELKYVVFMCWSWYRRYIIMVYFTRSSYQKACNLFILVMMRELAGDNLKITPIGFLESLFCVQIWYWVLPYPSNIELNCIFIIFNDLKKISYDFFRAAH